MLLPVGSKILVFFEHSISLSHLMDLKNALNLDITVVVNSDADYKLSSKLFNTKLIAWDFIDGDLVNSIMINDEQQMEALSTSAKPKSNSVSLDGLKEEARKVSASTSGSETNRLIASAFLNILSTQEHLESKEEELTKYLKELEEKNVSLEASLSGMASDMDDFIKTYKLVQAQISSRNIVDVMRDNSVFQLPSNITSLVIKNYGIPHLMRFILALKDALTTSFDRYTKVVYIAEPDSVSIQEINRSHFFLLSEETKASDLLKNDLLLCVGNTREPLEFLTASSSLDVLIIIDSRRTTNELITGQTMELYTAMDLDTALNLNLEPTLTITSSDKSIYTLKESDFIGKKRHALRNNDLVTKVANTLLGK